MESIENNSPEMMETLAQPHLLAMRLDAMGTLLPITAVSIEIKYESYNIIQIKIESNLGTGYP